jgi:hypothetical protein
MTRIRYRLAWALSAALLTALPTIVSAASWRPRLGIEAGPNFGRMNSIALIETEEHWSLGGSAGVVARWDLGPNWAIEAAPGWERLVDRESGAFALSSGGTVLMSAEFEETLCFDRVATPVRAVFHPGRSSWSIEGGISAAWLAHAERTTELANEYYGDLLAKMARRRATPSARIFEEIGTFDLNDWTRNFHRWDASAVAGVGWDRPVAARVLRVRVRWQQGFTDFGKFYEPVRVTAGSAQVGLLW